MTPAEHAALSAQLALALGWRIVDVVEVTDYEGQFVDTVCKVRNKGARFSRLFDYRDATIALPVLEWLMREHGAVAMRSTTTRKFFVAHGSKWTTQQADTLHEAIARAAIAVMEGK